MCRYRNLRHKCPNCDYIWDNPQSDEPFVKKVRKTCRLTFQKDLIAIFL